MAQITYWWRQFLALIVSLFSSMDWRNMLDIVIVTLIIYQIVKLVRQTRANSVLKGLAFILALTWLSGVMELTTVNWLLLQIINTGVIVLVVLFQPELRRGLEQIGRSRLGGSAFTGAGGTVSADHVAQELVQAATNLARRKVGALIVIERQTGLRDVIQNGIALDAEVSAALIENIFEPNTPLHDGALVLREGRIAAAACFLPLSEDSNISRELGTRHRAALGISETTDAVALICSEETGILSVAREGRLSRYLDAKSMHKMLVELFAPEAPPTANRLWRIFRREGRHE